MLINQLSVYFYNQTSANTRDVKAQEELMQFQIIINNCAEKLSWINNELYKNEKIIFSYLTNELADYQNLYKDFFAFKKHKLNNKLEKILTNLSPSISNYNKIFSILINSDFLFNDVLDSKNKLHHLTVGNYYSLFTSNDPELRKNSFLTYWSKYFEFKNTLSCIYYNNVLSTIKLAKIYKYKSSVNEELKELFLPDNFFKFFLNNIAKYSYLTSKYFKIVLKIIKVKDPKPWDLSQPLFKKYSDKKYSLEEAQNIIINAVNILGDDYKTKLIELLNNNCIDYMPNDGKRQGAYSYSAYGIRAYICMNFNNKYDDVSTLIHELGHSMHSLYSDKFQPYHYHSYSIFIAEIASTVNEILLFDFMWKNNHNNEDFLKALLEKLINLFINTIFRQAMFADYEIFAHEHVEKNQILTSEIISKKCIEIEKKYFPYKENLKWKNKFKGLWGIYVPHFYSDFYVYKYASSMICSILISIKLKKDSTFKNKYKWFLSQGSRHHVLDLLKMINIDLLDNKNYLIAFNFIEEKINLLNKLIKK